MSVSSERQSLEAPRRERRVHHKSYSIVGVMGAALLFFAYWGIARLFICWGNDDESFGAAFGCRGAHWVVLVLLVIGIVIAWFLVRELSEISEVRFEGRRMRRLRSAYFGYQHHLTTHEKWSSGSAIGLLLAGVLGLIWIVLLSSIRF